MSTWQHKGFEIALNGATFASNVNGKSIRSSSLNAARKAIDKHLEVKAKEIPLSLPVLIVKGEKVEHATITGLDQETLEATGENLGTIRGFGRASVMPDVDGMEAIYRKYRDAERAYEEARDAFREHTISVYFERRGYGKTTYADAVKKLQDSYTAASKL